MKLRMYLRGLGIGIIVTALLMGLSTQRSQKITDAEIIERAQALGMVKENSEILSKQEEPKAEEPKAEEPKAEEPKEEEPKAEEPEEEQTEEADSIEPADTAVITSGTFTLEIASGSPSEQVSSLLAKGGVIKSASDFDEYLCNNGYDHRICAGSHVIPAGADYETIAKIITSR